MRIAVIADIHGNAQALDAVLAKIREAGPDLTVCLGDIVGYGANPGYCIARLRETTEVVVAGNHDKDISNGASSPGTNPIARLLQDWTRHNLNEEELHYLSELPNRVVDSEEFVAVHGCYLNDVHVTGYVTSTMLETNLHSIADREEWPALAFCGHTHIPLCGWIDRGTFIEQKLKTPIQWSARAQAVLINPGSVGQPRDGDPRAAFALIDTRQCTAEVIRIDYDIKGAARAIEISGLPMILAERLHQGR